MTQPNSSVVALPFLTTSCLFVRQTVAICMDTSNDIDFLAKNHRFMETRGRVHGSSCPWLGFWAYTCHMQNTPCAKNTLPGEEVAAFRRERFDCTRCLVCSPTRVASLLSSTDASKMQSGHAIQMLGLRPQSLEGYVLCWSDHLSNQ